MSLKKYLPKSVKNSLHFLLAWWGAVKYRYPSNELFVIGITGTSGKSSVIHFLRQVLMAAGYSVGSLSTVDFFVNGETKLNDKKMTMLGRFAIQRYLRQMVDQGCDVAIVETTSEGAVQHRHRFINYDVMMLTNLYPEHIESHGSFENYKGAKLSIFSHVASSRRKTLARTAFAGKRVPKTAVVNANNEYSPEFVRYPFDRTMYFGRTDRPLVVPAGDNTILATVKEISKNGLMFTVNGEPLHAPLFGEHTIMNLSAVAAVCRSIGISWDVIRTAFEQLASVPGRIEFIPEAREHGVSVIVDYAFEPVAMAELYKVIRLQQPARVIHVFGSTGGGRDTSRRFTIGEMLGREADICIVTDEDPYDDNPAAIMADVATAVERAGKVRDVSYFVVPDRRAAIARAWNLAKPGDLIAITGKGSEQKIVRAGGVMEPWDDREVVREVIRIGGK